MEYDKLEAFTTALMALPVSGPEESEPPTFFKHPYRPQTARQKVIKRDGAKIQRAIEKKMLQTFLGCPMSKIEALGEAEFKQLVSDMWLQRSGHGPSDAELRKRNERDRLQEHENMQCLRLVIAVYQRALDDLVVPNLPNLRTLSAREISENRADAMAWFLDDSEERMSFRFCAELLGLNVAEARRGAIEKFKAAKNKWAANEISTDGAATLG